jgi:hypothetical protein
MLWVTDARALEHMLLTAPAAWDATDTAVVPPCLQFRQNCIRAVSKYPLITVPSLPIVPDFDHLGPFR